MGNSNYNITIIPFLFMFYSIRDSTPYPRQEIKPAVLLLYTNSVVLKKLTAPNCLFFYNMSTKLMWHSKTRKADSVLSDDQVPLFAVCDCCYANPSFCTGSFCGHFLKSRKDVGLNGWRRGGGVKWQIECPPCWLCACTVDTFLTAAQNWSGLWLQRCT